MLVLTRKLMEKLYIGDDVCVTVVRLEGGQVRLGIEAPREIAVVRAELLDRPRAGRPATPDAGPDDPAADGDQDSTSRGSRNRYPTPRTVSMRSAASPSFFRRLLTWTSMVRSRTTASSPIAASISSWRVNARPGLAEQGLQQAELGRASASAPRR